MSASWAKAEWQVPASEAWKRTFVLHGPSRLATRVTRLGDLLEPKRNGESRLYKIQADSAKTRSSRRGPSDFGPVGLQSAKENWPLGNQIGTGAGFLTVCNKFRDATLARKSRTFERQNAARRGREKTREAAPRGFGVGCSIQPCYANRSAVVSSSTLCLTVTGLPPQFRLVKYYQ